MTKIAQGTPVGPRLEGPGQLGVTTHANGYWIPFDDFNTVMSIAIGTLSVVAGIWFLFLVITGAISYMQSGGDQNKAEAARNKITTGAIGVVVVLAAVFIADFVGNILGFDILNPGQFFFNLGTLF